MNDRRITLFVYAGREPNLVVQRPCLDRLLRDWPGLTVELWNLTRNDEDDAYVRGLHDPAARVIVRNELHQGKNDWPIGCRRRAKRQRWCGCRDCRPAPFEEPYRLYANDPSYAGSAFVKLDDDVVFLETDRFGDLFAVLDDHPNAVVSAGVVNNVVSAKHMPDLRRLIESVYPDLDSQKAWFDLHADGDFARISHDWFLREAETAWERGRDTIRTPDGTSAVVERALPGERPSINCVAFTHATMQLLSATMHSPRFAKMGDEGSICQNFLPRIALSFRAAHLYFGPQRIQMTDEELDAYRARYADLIAEYLRGA